MPLAKGSSPKTISKNIAELHRGNTYSMTEQKHGKATADRQSIAIAEQAARKSKPTKKK